MSSIHMARMCEEVEVGMPVRVGGRRGKVVRIDGDKVTVQFPPEVMTVDRRMLSPDLAESTKHKAAPEMTK